MLIGNDAFQEADIVGITRPCTKHNYLVKHVDDIALTIKEAFHIAQSGRPGPVLVDLPKDVVKSITNRHCSEHLQLQGYKPTYSGHLGQVKRALEEILEAKKPVIYAGGGIITSNSSREFPSISSSKEAAWLIC